MASNLKHRGVVVKYLKPLIAGEYIMRKLNNKFFLFLPVIIVFFANQGCDRLTVQDFHLNESARSHHARQLLNKGYASSVAKEFESDTKFASYLSKYIAKENAKIDSHEMSQSLFQVSRDYFYDPVFLLAVAKTESQFNPNAIGLAGEIGLMQIKPETAEWICMKKKINWKGAAALKDPAYNILVGAAYFDYLKKKLRSKNAHYINAYNMGINNLQRLPASSRISHPYYDKVLTNYNAIYVQLKKIRQNI